MAGSSEETTPSILSVERRISFRESLREWYQKQQRILPWRVESDPYRVWISEIMAQQTQIATVIPYFESFVSRFPDPWSLAQATDDALYKAWEGLGYYRRAFHARKAARQLIEEGGGVFPRTAADWQELPGIGPYTAAAIASICFHDPVPVLDGNVYRVISRLFAERTDIASHGAQRVFLPLARQLLCTENPGLHNQAMMELGALLCKPKSPKCLICPVSSFCETRRAGIDPETFPIKSRKVRVHQRSFDVFFCRSDAGQVSLCRQTEGLCRGLYALPHVHVLPEAMGEEKPLFEISHRYTHVEATYRLMRERSLAELEARFPGQRWVFRDLGEGLDLALAKFCWKLIAEPQWPVSSNDFKT